ncbi:NADH pyrophosphatase [Spironucleus salmonicida]|uniref:NADH pyrophosphatase n=1 Tax=Spironucleus salmonicida TaxID=348837 RepID=V6LC08_9EUKA|nr:NADH pyrophosphatase [Spironucleus salmonicida]|eukprot:EST41758.1 NADH pyrophosphatase [Spironucleus salmonicida]
MKVLDKDYYFVLNDIERVHRDITQQTRQNLINDPKTLFVFINEKNLHIQQQDQQYLFSLQDVKTHISETELSQAALLGFQLEVPIFSVQTNAVFTKQFLCIDSPDVTNTIIPALSLSIAKFHQTVKFCSQCGQKLVFLNSTQVFLYCNQCKKEVYPQIQPSVIMMITCGDKMLLCHRHSTLYTHSCGFVEIIETLENAVLRELQEEIGFDPKYIKRIEQLQGSQPWPGTYMSLMIPYWIEVNEEFECQITVECTDYKWVTEEQWRVAAERVDSNILTEEWTVRSKKTIARSMMEYFVNHKNQMISK